MVATLPARAEWSGKLADSVLDDNARVKGFPAVASGTCQGVGYQAGAFYAFYLVDQSQDGGRDMDAVGHHFHRHVVQQIDAFYRAFVFVLAAFVGNRAIAL